MQEEITRLVQGLDDSALRFIEACVRHERETRNAPQVPPPSMPHPGGQFTVPENVRHLTSEQLDAVSKAFLDWYKASVSTTQGRSRGRLWRLGEVLSIDDRTDLDFARSVVSVRGQNFRELQFPEAIMTEIRQVLESPLMFGLRGEVLHLDQGYVRRIFYERAKDVDLPKELLSPRVIRHSRGIELLRGDVPLKIVQQFLGQQSPTLTASYLHFSREDARKIVHSHIRREAMKKTSARNAFTGTINRIKRGDLLVEVEILTSTGLQVVSIIKAESADNLELREGINTTATIKAPWVIISTGDAPTSARNHFSGKVQSVQLGEIEAEVLVTLDEGTTVCAVITSQSARVLKLEPGKPVSVLFKAFGDVNEILGRKGLSEERPFPSTPKDFRLYRIPIAGDCQERKSLLRTRGRLFAIGENRKPGKTRAAEKRRRFSVFVLAAVFLPVTLPPAARGAKGRPARSPGGRDNRRGHAGSCHCGRRPASPQRRPRRRDHG